MGIEIDQTDAGFRGAGTAAIESEPAQPEYKTTQCHLGKIMSGYFPGRAVRAEFPKAWAQHDDAGQGDPATDRMHDGRINKAHPGQPALSIIETAPDPAAINRVNKRTDDDGPNKISLVARAFRHSTTGDGDGRSRKHGLEEQQAVVLVVHITKQEVRGTDQPAGVIAEHQTITHQPERQTAYANIHVVFHHDIHGIFRPCHTALQQRKSCLHEEDECTGSNQPDRIHTQLQGLFIGKGSGTYKDQEKEQSDLREFHNFYIS